MTCSCGASEANGWKHSRVCIWRGCSQDAPYNNALKIRLVDKAIEEADEYNDLLRGRGFEDRVEE